MKPLMHMNLRRNTQLVAAIALTTMLLGTFSVSPAAAATAESPSSDTAASENEAGAALTVSPPTFEVRSDPGQTIDKEIKVTNGGTEERVITPTLQNFTAADELGNALLTADQTQFPLADYMKVSPNNIKAKAGEEVTFKLHITVPSDPQPGGHYGAVIFEGSSPTASSGVTVKSQVTSLVLLTISGDVTETAEIASFSASNPNDDPKVVPERRTFYQQGPVNFAVRVKATGNTLVKATPTIEVSNLWGKKIATLTADARNVLPGSIRRWDIPWQHKELFGRYSAKLVVTYGTSDPPQKLENGFTWYGAPLAKVITIGVIIIVLFIVFWLPRKRLKKAFRALTSD